MLSPALDQPPPRQPPGSRRRRAGAGLLLAVLLLAGVPAGAELLDRPESRAQAPSPVPPAFPGVRATSQLLAEDRLRVRLLVEVRITAEPVSTGPPGSGAAAAQVRLQAVTAPGLVVRLPHRPAPVMLGYVGRFGNGLDQVVRLSVDVVALGCAEPARPRRLSLALTRRAGSSDVDVTLPVQDRAEVVRALEELVRRSCG